MRLIVVAYINTKLLMKNVILTLMFLSIGISSCAQDLKNKKDTKMSASNHSQIETIEKSDKEWQKTLTADQYYVLRQQGTEAAFSGEYFDHKGKGTYVCAACGNELFSSKAKFRSGTGWPSFFEPISANHIGTEEDGSFGMTRIEVHCAKCGGHLGHVFNDGPNPTGLRYCINSVSLGFEAK